MPSMAYIPNKYSLSSHSWKCKHILGDPKIAFYMVYSAAFAIQSRSAFTHWLHSWIAGCKANSCKPNHNKMQQEFATERKSSVNSFTK